MSSRNYKICIAMAKDQVKYDKPVVVFDLGCNINDVGNGEGFLDDFTAIALSNFQEVEKVWAFEPVGWQRFETVYENNPQVTLVKKALDENASAKEIYTPGADQLRKGFGGALSSFFLREVFVKYDEYDKAAIECDTIDLFTEANDIECIDYLKIDTEGAEFRVLRGAEKMLKAGKISAIQLEHGGTYDDAGFTMKEIHDFLLSFGYVKRHQNSTEMLYTF